MSGIVVDAIPQFIFVGFGKPGGSVRLYASRSFPRGAPGFWNKSGSDGPAVWQLDADLDRMLVIDQPSWPEAMAKVFEIWGNEDAEKARKEAITDGKQGARAIEGTPAGTAGAIHPAGR